MPKYMNNGPSSQHPLLLGRQQPHPLSPSIQTINQDEAENPKKWSTPNKSYSTVLGLCPQSLGFREAGLEPSPKRDSDNMLRQGKKTATENKSYRTTWTHIGEPSTLKGRRKTCAKNRQDRSPGESLRIAVNLASATRSAKPQTHWTWETLCFCNSISRTTDTLNLGDPIRSSWTWKELSQIHKVNALQHIKTSPLLQKLPIQTMSMTGA